MKLQARVLFRDRYDGDKAVYLTGVDLETGGDIKVSGEFGQVPMMVPVILDATIKGRLYNNQLQLNVIAQSVVVDPHPEELAKAAEPKARGKAG